MQPNTSAGGRRSPLLFAPIAVAASLVLTPPASAQSTPVVGWTIDRPYPSFSPIGGLAVEGDVIYVAREGFQQDPWIEVHEFDAACDRFVLRDWIAGFPLGMRSAKALAVDGGVLAVQPRHWSSGILTCEIFERRGSSWARASVPLDEIPLNGGRTVDLEGDRAVVLGHGPWFGGRYRLHVIERSAAGSWENVESIELPGARSEWAPEEVAWVDLDGDRVAISGARMSPEGVIAVIAERGPGGSWSQTTTLRAPEAGHRAVGWNGLALAGNRLAVATRKFLGTNQYEHRVWVFEPDAVGRWVPTQSFAGTAVALHADRLAVSHDSGVELLELQSSGTFARTHSIAGLGLAVHVDGERVVGWDRRVARVVPLPAGGPSHVQAPRDRGVPVCEPGPCGSFPRLRAFYEASMQVPVQRVAVEVEGASPGVLVAAFMALDVGTNPAAGGGLCLSPSSALRFDAPAVTDAQGRATLRLSAERFPAPWWLPVSQPFFVQALIHGATPQATHAVRVVL